MDINANFLSLISCRIEYVYKEKYLKELNNSDRSKISADENHGN